MSSRPDPRLIARLEPLAEVVTPTANRPFELHPEEQAWLIVAGSVDVFYRRTIPGEGANTTGRRSHLGTAGVGDVLFGFAPASGSSSGLHFLATGNEGARLLRVPLASLVALARDPELLPWLAAAVESWVCWLLQRCEKPAPPQKFDLLAASAELSPQPGAAVRPEGDVVWFRLLAGSCSLLGEDELSLRPTSYLLPLAADCWLRCADSAIEVAPRAGVPTESHAVDRAATEEAPHEGQDETPAIGAVLSGVGTQILLRSGALWEALLQYHHLCLRYLALELARAEQRERQRLDVQRRRDQQTFEQAHQRLASVLGSSAPSPDAIPGGDAAPRHMAEDHDPRSDDLLAAACRLVFDEQGLEFQAPAPHASRSRDPVARFAAAAHLRHRRVLLRDDWWQRDNGPLLAFRLPAGSGPGSSPQMGTPVALLPLSPTRYEMVDPRTGSRQIVDAEVAETLQGTAVMFYPPLPDRAVTPLDLLRLALRGRQQDLRMLILMGIGGGVLAMLTPVLTGQIVGRVIPEANRSLLLQMGLALTFAALAAAAFQITRGIAVLRLGGKIDGTVQAAVWDRLLALPLTFFRRFSVGDLAARSLGIDTMREMLTGNVTTSLLAAVFSGFSFALLFYYNWRLALFASGLVLTLMLVTITLTWLQLRHQRALLRLQGRLESLLFALISGISKLRVAGAEPRAFALWAEYFTQQRQRAIQARSIANIQAAFNAAYGVLTSLGIFAMVALSTYVELSISDFIAFNAAYGQFQAAALSVTGLLSSLIALVPIYERARPILDTVPEVDATKADAGELRGELEFSHVSFRYRPDGPLILDDVSLRASPGEFIALVGPSGSGKSTCLRLVLGFEEPAAGSIYFDGQDLPSLDIQSVRRQIGVVLQSSQPMPGSIFSNIVGGSNLTFDDAWAAAEMAGLAKDIKQMPMGMHTIVSEGGSTFSGGQKQRLLIARALVHRPRILLFDEATSALDNRTQEVVSRSLERLKATRVVVAHRLSTIRNADRIYVLERGHITEHGNYDELMQMDGAFARLARRQLT